MKSGWFNIESRGSRLNVSQAGALAVAVTSQELKAFRRQTAKDEAPWIAGSVAGITAVFAVTNSVVGPEADISKNIPTLLTALVLLLCADSKWMRWRASRAMP